MGGCRSCWERHIHPWRVALQQVIGPQAELQDLILRPAVHTKSGSASLRPSLIQQAELGCSGCSLLHVISMAWHKLEWGGIQGEQLPLSECCTSMHTPCLRLPTTLDARLDTLPCPSVLWSSDLVSHKRAQDSQTGHLLVSTR